MVNVTNNRTLCCSLQCERRGICGRADINNIGFFSVENWYSFGSGNYTNNGWEIEYYCGPQGNWKMWEEIGSGF